MACLARRCRGRELWRAQHGPCRYPAGSQRRIRSFALPVRNPQVPDAGAAGGIHAGQALARA
ncbi:hypothetical protein LVY71_05965 [Bradyrhizobium sp. G127]|nr:hypothetical protein [Bradyrhizobium sp. G127]MCF2522305.1 hypothetical protein [Bradyrhizobium sp. G127]